jgi:hypothetical protein
MPRNIITPYECRRHEVRGCKPQPTPASERRESHKIPSFRRLHEGDDDTPHFATRYARRLVRGYSFSLLAELRPVLRTLLYVSYVLLSIKTPTPSACSHSPYIFRAENTVGEKITVCDMKIAPTEHFRRGNVCDQSFFLLTAPPWQLLRC